MSVSRCKKEQTKRTVNYAGDGGDICRLIKSLTPGHTQNIDFGVIFLLLNSK